MSLRRIVIEVIFEAFEGKADALRDLCQRTVTATLPETGCILYLIVATMKAERQFILFRIRESESDPGLILQETPFVFFPTSCRNQVSLLVIEPGREIMNGAFLPVTGHGGSLFFSNTAS